MQSTTYSGIFCAVPKKNSRRKTQEFRNSSKKLKLKPKFALFGIFVEKNLKNGSNWKKNTFFL